MAEIDAKMIKDLREITGMGFTDCKKALVDANGSMEEAEMILRKKGLDKAAKKADRATGEGVISIVVRDNVAVLLQIECEQEPTTNNDRFKEVLAATVEAAFASGAQSVEDMLKASVGGQTIAEKIQALIGVIGENVVVKKLSRVVAPAGGVIGSYSHFNKKAGAVCALALEGGAVTPALQTAANDVCMHSVAARPLSLDRSGIPADVVAKEREVFLEEVKTKPANIQEKILEGKLGKFYGEKCLLEQIFVKDPDGKLTVGAMVEKAGKDAGGKASVVSFIRMELGC